MFFRHLLFVVLLLSHGCVGRTIREDNACEVVPHGAAAIVSRSFAPEVSEFVHSLTFSTFEDDECGYAGYYCPGIGIRMLRRQVGRTEFETNLVHEVLHAVHFHGLVDKDRFQAALDRLRADPDYKDFVSEVKADGWKGFVYSLFTQSEYFARVGEEIVQRRGINVPTYLWDIYRGILHPAIEENGRLYQRNPFPAQADIVLAPKEIITGQVLKYALGLRSVHDNVVPRSGMVGMHINLDLDLAANHRSSDVLLFRRRSNSRIITSASGMCMAGPDQRPRLRCYLSTEQAQAVISAWLDHDLGVETFDPTLAMHRHR